MDDPVKISVLPLPQRKPPSVGSFDTRPATVKRWVDALPMASLKQSARQIYETLKEVNGLDIAPRERFAFLEQLRAPVAHISEELESRYIEAAFPLPTLEYRIASLNQKYQEVMATGYKLVLQDLLDPPPSPLRRLAQRGLVCTAVHRALRYMGQILLRCYQIYAPYPENTWREIHHLFEVASALDCVYRKIADAQYATIQRSIAEEAYKQILLFALASPYQLRPGECTSVYRALERWASCCRLSRISEADHELQGLFGIQPDTDQQPTYLELKSHHAGQTTWVLDTAELGAVLRERAARLRNGTADSSEPPQGLSTDLLERLMHSWGIMTERSTDRIRQEGQMEVVLGFTATHRALTAPNRQSDDLGAAAHELELTLEDDSGAHWAAAAHHHQYRDHQTESFLCVIRDETPGGLRLQWHGDSRLKLSVGNLIGLRAPSPPEGDREWTLGVVRWLRATQTDAIQFGVQRLPGRPEPVQVQPLVAGQGSGRPVQGFRLLEPPASENPSSLLAPGFLEHFDDHPEVLILSRDTEQELKLTRLIESTGILARFEYEPITEPAPRASPASLEQETSFENLSDLL